MERDRTRPPQPPKQWPTIHHSELPEVLPGSPFATEWSFYCGIVGDLLAEGQEGKWLLIKGREVVGIWSTEAKVSAVRLQQGGTQSMLMKQVLDREPMLRTEHIRLCHNRPSPLASMAWWSMCSSTSRRRAGVACHWVSFVGPTTGR
jgi:hypothetical protein